MRTRMWAMLVLGLAAVAPLANPPAASAQQYVQSNPYYTGYQLNRYFYFPYYYFPHNYWPVMTPRWPEPQGARTCGRQATWRTRRFASRAGHTTCGSRCATTAARISGWISFESLDSVLGASPPCRIVRQGVTTRREIMYTAEERSSCRPSPM